MPSSFSPSLRVELISLGEQAGTWGTTTNTNLGTLLESAIAGAQTISIIAADQALTIANGAADQSRSAVLRFTTTTGANFSVYAPPVAKQYTVVNASSFTATVFASTVAGNTTPAGTGITVPAGRTMTVRTDGVDFVQQNTHFISPTIAGGTINDASIGATAASTGAFTNLSASGTLSVTGVATLGNGAILGTPASGVVTNLTGTASININGTVGATTASTGAFTNLAYSGTLTGGTGVVNLGSGQLFKDANGNVGIGTSSPSRLLNVNGIAKANIFDVNGEGFLRGDVAGELRIQGGTTATTFRNSANNAEFMRIDSAGNVGIGTSSPGQRLQVAGNTKIGTGVSGNSQVLMVNTPSGTAAGLQLFQDANESWAIANPSSTTALTFANSGIERMRITSAGNVGIGTSSPGDKLNVAGGGLRVDRGSNGTSALFRSNDGTNNTSLQIIHGTSGITLTSSNPFTGAFNNLMFSNTSVGETMRIDPNGNLLFNSGFGSVAIAFGCRAWVNFNGEGGATIRASRNVSSVTRNGTGNYTINFATAMPDANYSAQALAGSPGARRGLASISQSQNSVTASAIGVEVISAFAGNAVIDVSQVHVAVFR